MTTNYRVTIKDERTQNIVVRNITSPPSKVTSVNGDIGSVRLGIDTNIETQDVVAGQTVLNLTTITLTSDKPMIFVDGYIGSKYINEFTVNSDTQITLTNPIEGDGRIFIIDHSLANLA